MKKFICAANWKMNKGPKETEAYFQEFLETTTRDEQAHYVFFTPTVCLGHTAQCLKETNVRWGAQNSYFQDAGAFTGETSPQILSELGANISLLGHSERRHIFGETNEEIHDKVLALQKWNIPVMLCVGETLEERDSGNTDQVIQNQLTMALKDADPSKEIIVAYEPVWAIGTGKVATPEIAEEAHKTLRQTLEKIFDVKKAQEISILYGGSVKAENAKSLHEKDNIDGFLVGGASLKVDSFKGIFKAVK